MNEIEEYELVREDLVDAEDKEPEWIWRYRVPRNKVTLVSGDSGVGKTHAIASFITCILKREDFPDGEPPEEEPGHILIMTSESDTRELRRILKAQGCDDEDLQYIHRYNNLLKKGIKEPKSFDIDRHSNALEMEIQKFRPIMILFDPLVEFHMRREIDSHQVRELMVKLNTLCEKYSLSILSTIHWNKNSNLSAHLRTSGSHQYSAGVKSVIIIHEDKHDSGLKHFYQDKHNLGPEPPKLAFTIEKPEGFVAWQKVEGVQPHSKVDEVQYWLESHLHVPMTADQIVAASGYSKRTVYRARANLKQGLYVTDKNVDGKRLTYWELLSEKNNWGAGALSIASPGP